MRIPYFERAYQEDGYTHDEFNTHPALIATATEFSKATENDGRFCCKTISREMWLKGMEDETDRSS